MQNFDAMESTAASPPKAVREQVQVTVGGAPCTAWMYISLLPEEEAEDWDIVHCGRVQAVIVPDEDEDNEEGGKAAASGLAMMMGVTDAFEEDEEEEEDMGEPGSKRQRCN